MIYNERKPNNSFNVVVFLAVFGGFLFLMRSHYGSTAIEEPISNEEPEIMGLVIRPQFFREDNLKEKSRLERLAKKYPSNAQYLFRLGHVELNLGMLTADSHERKSLIEARKYVEAGMKLDEKSDYGWFLLGTIELEMGNQKSAEAAYLKSSALNQQSRWAYILGGEIAVKKKDYREAKRLYGLAAQFAMTPTGKRDAQMNEVDASCEIEPSCPGARPILEGIIASYPEDPWVLHNAAVTFYQMEDFKRVIELERKALTKMDFGAAKLKLSQGLASYAEKILENANENYLPRAMAEVEPIVAEAASLDSPPSDLTVQFTLTKIAIIRARLGKTPELWNRARRLLSIVKRLDSSATTTALEDYFNRIEAKTVSEQRQDSGRTADPNPAFAQLFEQSQIDIKMPGGRHYDSVALAGHMPEILKVARKCLFGSTKFSSAVEVDQDGNIKRWENQHFAQEHECMKAKLINMKIARPPFAPFHLHLMFSLRGH
jgi:tetratricopeptide (TPR) repeat protein